MQCKRKECTNIINKWSSLYCSRDCYLKGRTFNYAKNKIEHRGRHSVIHLKGGYECLVSSEDINLVKDRLWHYTASNGVISNLRQGEREPGKHGHIKLHRLVMQPPDGLVVDHINGDRLDNRRSNLRVVTHGQNQINSESRPMRNIEFSNGSYCVRLGVNKKRIYIGRYKDLEDAKIARDKAAKKYHGEYRSR